MNTNTKIEFPLIGVGASSGGLKNFITFLENFPNDCSNASLVLIQHLSPNFPSTLAEIIAKHTNKKLKTISNNDIIDIDTIYVLSEGNYVTIENKRFVLHKLSDAVVANKTIDIFFTSLAHNFNTYAIGVILSGNGVDGSRGIKSIIDCNGKVFIQDPSTAEYPSMPEAAIATKNFDNVAETKDIPMLICKYIDHLCQNLSINSIITEKEVVNKLSQISNILKFRTGADFSLYKITTIARRLEKRMKKLNLQTLDQYISTLQTSETEAEKLFSEFLIGVTKFFRDIKPFEILEEKIIPEIVNKIKPPNERILKIWVPACSTGEEAYTIAILFKEYLEKIQSTIQLQVLASDIDPNAITKARKGTFHIDSSADIPPYILKKYFEVDGNFIKISKDIRNLMIFAEHNIESDPPYSKIDFISCRNLFIYLSTVLQERILGYFSFSLCDNGVLLLGNSESIGSYSSTFSVLDKKWKFFQKIPSHPRQRIYLNSKNWNFSKLITKEENDTMPAQDRKSNIKTPTDIVTQIVLERFTHSTVMINSNGEIVQIFGNVNKYLERKTGIPSNNIIENAKNEIKIPLANAIRNAAKTQKQEIRDGIKFQENEKNYLMKIIVTPLDDYKVNNCLLVTFIDSGKEFMPSENANTESCDDNNKKIEALELELFETRQYLQSTVEELENTNEELTSSNEEAQSVNEELQSANEELESSKEELQSANDELSSLNAENKSKIEDLTRLNNDFQNLIRGTQIAMVFLDKNLKIKRFTPAISEIIPLLASDIDRPLNSFKTKFTSGNLLEDACEVISTLAVKEKEITTDKNKIFLQRIIPYRTNEDKIDGVIILFLNITQRKFIENELLEEKQKFQQLFTNLSNGFALHEIILDKNGLPIDYMFLEVNPAFEKMTGLKSSDIIGKRVKEVLPQIEHFWVEAYGKVAITGEQIVFENYTKDINKYYEVLAYRPAPNQFATIITDTTQRRVNEEALIKSEKKYRALFETIEQGIVYQDISGKITSANPAALKMLGLTIDQALGRHSIDPRWKAIDENGNEVNGNDHPAMIALRTGKSVNNTTLGIYNYIENSYKWLLINAVPEFKDGETTPHQVYTSFSDITNLKNAEKEKAQMQSKLSHSEKMAAIGTLTSGVAHEINNPLYFAFEYQDLMKETLQNSKIDINVQKQIELILEKQKKSLEKIKNIVHGMRTYLRSDNSSLENVNVHSCINEVVGLVEAIYQQENIKIKYNLSAKDFFIKGNNSKLSQVFINLLSNAKDAFKSTQTNKIIKISTHNSNNELNIHIEDNGVGIPNNILKNIFDPFFTTKDVGNGTGLGLSIAKNIVESFNGDLTVKSVENEGTVFSFNFPISINEENLNAKTIIKQLSSDTKLSGKVLVVDDEEEGIVLTKRQLTKLGFDVDGVCTVKEAILLTTQKQYDYIFTDMKMPGMDGAAFIKKLIENKSKSKIIVLSGATIEEFVGDDAETINKFIIGSLKKPITKEDILTVISASNVK